MRFGVRELLEGGDRYFVAATLRSAAVDIIAGNTLEHYLDVQLIRCRAFVDINPSESSELKSGCNAPFAPLRVATRVERSVVTVYHVVRCICTALDRLSYLRKYERLL
jgi:hypothetical protein